jgi:hypothetical protein
MEISHIKVKKKINDILIIKQRTYSPITAHVECKNKCDTSNNSSNLNHLNIIHKMPEQHTGKARNQKTTQVLEKVLCNVQNIHHGKKHDTYNKL